jgi:hypothetical protein
MEELNLELPNDFNENTNRNILLTGAGFSKDFGALLANEISIRLFNSKEITPDIKKKIAHIEDSNYEEVYESITDDEKVIYKELLLDIFKEIDSKLKIKNLSQIMKLFFNQAQYNFIFTLNQDLLLERYFLSDSLVRQSEFRGNNEAIKKNLDSIIRTNFSYTNYSLSNVVKHAPNSNGCIQPGEYFFDDFVQVIKFEKSCLPKIGFNNYIKIHGSSNWEDSEGNNMLITGKSKKSLLKKHKVLQYSFAMLEKTLSIAELKIVIIGYSFTDQHINKVLLNSIKNGSKLFIIDPMKFDRFKKNLKMDSNDKDDKSTFIDAIEKYFDHLLKDILDGKDRYLSMLEQELL